MLSVQQRRQLGFEVDFAAGIIQVPADRWEALKVSVESILAARQGRVLARKLASVTGTVLSMHLSWGLVTQLYTERKKEIPYKEGILKGIGPSEGMQPYNKEVGI